MVTFTQPASPGWASARPVTGAVRSSPPRHVFTWQTSKCRALRAGRTGGALCSVSLAAWPLLRRQRRGKAHLRLPAGRDWLGALVPELLSVIRRQKSGRPEGSGTKGTKGVPCKEAQELLEIEVVIENPIHPTSVWRPNKHASLESYLKSIDSLKVGYDITRADARFDTDHKSITINTITDLTTFLSLENRGYVYISIPEVEGWPRGIARIQDVLTQYSRGAMNRFMQWVQDPVVDKKTVEEQEQLRKDMTRFTQWVQDAEVDEEMVKKQEQLVKGIMMCEFTAFGDIDQYDRICMTRWDSLIESLKTDGFPPRVIASLKRAPMMDKLSRACFDLEYEGGKSCSAFYVRLLTINLGDNKMSAVIFRYQLRCESATNEKDGVQLALTPEQALAIERFVDKAALIKWQEKLQVSDAEDADVF